MSCLFQYMIQGGWQQITNQNWGMIGICQLAKLLFFFF